MKLYCSKVVNFHNERFQKYRIGTVVLHNDIEQQKIMIVDEQQRITTLLTSRVVTQQIIIFVFRPSMN